jgi:hypothetical protein
MKKMVATSSIKYDTDEMCTNDCKTQEIPLTVRLGGFSLYTFLNLPSASRYVTLSGQVAPSLLLRRDKSLRPTGTSLCQGREGNLPPPDQSGGTLLVRRDSGKRMACFSRSNGYTGGRVLFCNAIIMTTAEEKKLRKDFAQA